MTRYIALTSLLFAWALGMTTQTQAAEEHALSVSRETCAAAQQDIDAVSALLREALARHAYNPMGAAGYEALALELDPQLDALHASLPTPRAQRTEAGLLLSDMRDAVLLMRSARNLDVRLIAVQRIEQDCRSYYSLLKTFGCPETRTVPD